MKPSLLGLSLDPVVHFHFIAKHRSLKLAAQALNLSPPAVTHSLNKLEASLGVVLCERGKAGFRLTEQGKLLAKYAEAVIGSMNDYLEALNEPQAFSGILSIGVLDYFENEILDRAIETIVDQFPEVKLNITVENSDEINRLVASGELDAGFGIFHARLPRLKYLPIGSGQMRYYISDRHPLWTKPIRDKTDLYGQRVAWVDSQKRNLANLESEVFKEHPNYKMKVSAFTNGLDGALRILLSGHSVVPLPPSFVERMKGQSGIREINVKTNAPILYEHCVFNPKRHLPPPAQKLINAVSSAK